jgi:hypothetical protein
MVGTFAAIISDTPCRSMPTSNTSRAPSDGVRLIAICGWPAGPLARCSGHEAGAGRSRPLHAPYPTKCRLPIPPNAAAIKTPRLLRRFGLTLGRTVIDAALARFNEGDLILPRRSPPSWFNFDLAIECPCCSGDIDDPAGSMKACSMPRNLFVGSRRAAFRVEVEGPAPTPGLYFAAFLKARSPVAAGCNAHPPGIIRS